MTFGINDSSLTWTLPAIEFSNWMCAREYWRRTRSIGAKNIWRAGRFPKVLAVHFKAFTFTRFNWYRVDFTISFQELSREDNEFILHLILSDEAHFYFNGFVNKQNCRIWSTKNSKFVHHIKLHLLKCTIWCDVTSKEIIIEIFENDNSSDLR